MSVLLRFGALALTMIALVDPALERVGGEHYVALRARARQVGSAAVSAAVRASARASARVERSAVGDAADPEVGGERSDSTIPVRAVRAPVALPRGLNHARAKKVVASAARRLLGTPYDWGGENEDGVDCSGLIVVAYRQAGIELPHRSRVLFRLGTPVPITEVEPGDLVFFHNSNGKADHVGLYLGDGTMIHASSGSRRVVTAKLDQVAYANGLSGARRFIDHAHMPVDDASDFTPNHVYPLRAKEETR